MTRVSYITTDTSARTHMLHRYIHGTEETEDRLSRQVGWTGGLLAGDSEVGSENGGDIRGGP